MRRILGGFWEPEILDFRIFFDVFSKQILKRVSEEKKIDQNGPKDADDGFWGRGSGGPRAPGERKREGNPEPCGQNFSDRSFGVRTLQIGPEMKHLYPARRCHTCGGRRIETPQGGHRRPPTPAEDLGLTLT